MPTLAGNFLYLVFVPEVQNKQTGYKILEKLEVNRDNSISGKESDFKYIFKVWCIYYALHAETKLSECFSFSQKIHEGLGNWSYFLLINMLMK